MRSSALFRSILISLLALYPLYPAYAAESPAATLDLKAAVQTAIDRNPAILEARKKVEEQSILKKKAFSAVFPQISLIGQAFNKKDSILLGSNSYFDGNPYNEYSVALHATQVVYQYGLLSGFDLPDKDRQLSQLDLDIKIRDLSKNVIAAFYTLLLDQSTLANQQNIQKTEEESLKVAQHRYRIGRGQYLDELQAKTQLALLAPQIDKTRNQVKVDAVQLANLLGDPNAKEIQVTGSLDAMPLPAVRSKIQLKDAQLPEYQKAVLSLDRLSDEKAVALSPDLPQVGLLGEFGRNAFTKADILDSGATYWTVELQLTIPIFSGLSSIYTRHDFASQEAQLNLELNSVSNNLALAQVKSLKNLEVAYAGIQSSANAYDLAQQSLKEAQKQFRFGGIDYIQFLTVQQAYFQSQSALDQAKYAYVTSLVDYYVATGLPLSQLVKDLVGGNGS